MFSHSVLALQRAVGEEKEKERKRTYTRVQILCRTRKHLARVLGPVRPAWEFVNQRVCHIDVCFRASQSILPAGHTTPPLTKLLVKPLMVSHVRSIRRKVKHDGSFAPIGAVRRVVRDLAQEVEVRLANLSITLALSRSPNRSGINIKCELLMVWRTG